MFFMFAAAVVPFGIEATGMQPQLVAIKNVAAQRGWSVSCEGRAGEEGVVRLKAPLGADQRQVDRFSVDVLKFASGVEEVNAREASSPVCDREALRDGGAVPERVLAFGPSELLQSLQATARACGYAKAYVRPRKAGDDNASLAWELAIPTHTLDTGDDAPSRYGPRVCFMNLGIRPLGLLP